MATLTPILQVCSGNNCDKLTFTDITGLYNASNNTEGWGTSELSGVTIDDLRKVTITIKDLDGDELYVLTIFDSEASISQYPSDALDEMEFNDYSISLPDGIYQIVYNVDVTEESGHTVNDYTNYFLQDCAAKNCVQDLWVAFFSSPCDTSDEAAKEAESLLYGLQASFECHNIQEAAKILSTLNKICKINNCNC